jgi:putative redox protein
METIRTIYTGGLRTEATHVRSGSKLITDAPVDNNGKGEAFSPTDLLAASLGSCMLTVMGIKANQHSLNIDGIKTRITKVMGTDPRRVIEVVIEFEMPANNFSEKDRSLLEHTALHCPVAKSLHPDLKQTVSFSW